MGMSYSEMWKTNNFDKIAEMVMDETTMTFNQKDFDRVEQELFEQEYNKTKRMFYESLKEYEESLRLAHEALEFYGSYDNWFYDKITPRICDSSVNSQGKSGETARQALKDLEERHGFLRSQKMKDKERKEGAE